jgi:hypothetical protein
VLAAWAGMAAIIAKLLTTNDIWIMPRMVTLAYCPTWGGSRR